MKKSLNVLFVSPEVVPFAKTGGLADVAGALPKALADLGHQVRVVMPLYRKVEDGNFDIKRVNRQRTLDVVVGQRKMSAELWSTFMPGSNVLTYFLKNDGFFNRDELYRDQRLNGDYRDNDERFIFLSRGALELARGLNWRPDIFHINDWQTGLIPAYLKHIYADDPRLGGVPTLFSVHNLGYQGNFPVDTLDKLGLNGDLFYPTGPLEFWGQVSFMKAGLVFSDLINTVSERYAQEIQSGPEYGHGMEGVLESRSADLFGIVNGIDYQVWNPEADEFIPHRYSPDDLSGKRRNKDTLLRKNRLPLRKRRVPLIGMISRLADQKGFDLLAEVADDVMALDLQLVLLGTGEEKYHRLLEDLAKRYPTKLAANLTFDNELAHLIEAGADLFLMPSRYEPCGLNQLYSLKYGTIPVVRSTGGLADTIVDFDSGEGTGFVFVEYTGKELLNALRRALAVYAHEEEWVRLMKRAMAQDFSWRRSAERYVDLYRRALARRKG